MLTTTVAGRIVNFSHIVGRKQFTGKVFTTPKAISSAEAGCPCITPPTNERLMERGALIRVGASGQQDYRTTRPSGLVGPSHPTCIGSDECPTRLLYLRWRLPSICTGDVPIAQPIIPEQIALEVQW